MLVRDADEHEAWHDDLDELLTAPQAIGVEDWPDRDAGQVFG